MAAARFVVRGRVQGVGFRYFVRSTARALRVDGWVRNGDDGSVTAVAVGSDAALAQFERRLRAGPPGARVETVSRTEPQTVDSLPHPFAIVR